MLGNIFLTTVMLVTGLMLEYLDDIYMIFVIINLIYIILLFFIIIVPLSKLPGM